MSTGLARPVQTRLVRHAKTLDVDPNLVLTRYATERLLYRLSRSQHAKDFVLKGALLLLVWLGETIRPTRDADLLGYGDLDAEALARSRPFVATWPPGRPEGRGDERATVQAVPGLQGLRRRVAGGDSGALGSEAAEASLSRCQRLDSSKWRAGVLEW